MTPDTVYRCKYDDFEGTPIGEYLTREGKPGLVLQQVGTRVVHVYGVASLKIVRVGLDAADLSPLVDEPSPRPFVSDRIMHDALNISAATEDKVAELVRLGVFCPKNPAGIVHDFTSHDMPPGVAHCIHCNGIQDEARPNAIIPPTVVQMELEEREPTKAEERDARNLAATDWAEQWNRNADDFRTRYPMPVPYINEWWEERFLPIVRRVSGDAAAYRANDPKAGYTFIADQPDGSQLMRHVSNADPAPDAPVTLIDAAGNGWDF